MWCCPICSGKENKEYKCLKCGFDIRGDFVNYQTICAVSEEDVRNRKKYEDTVEEVLTIKYLDGEYKGHTKAGKRSGQGIFYWSDGRRYEGQWKSDMMDGEGVFYWPSGDRYEGEWETDVMEGQGTYYWSDGSRYKGEWGANMKEGYGTYYWPDGRSYEGEWKEDKQEGHGSSYYADGEHYEGNLGSGEKRRSRNLLLGKRRLL